MDGTSCIGLETSVGNLKGSGPHSPGDPWFPARNTETSLEQASLGALDLVFNISAGGKTLGDMAEGKGPDIDDSDFGTYRQTWRLAALVSDTHSGPACKGP